MICALLMVRSNSLNICFKSCSCSNTYHVGLSDVSLAYNMVVSILLVLLLVLLYSRYIMVLGGIRKRPTKVQTNTEKNRA